MNQNIVYEKAKTVGSEIQSHATNVQTELAAISTEMDAVSGSAWQSANASQFKSQFETLSSSFKEVFAAIDTMGQALANSGSSFENFQ